MNAYAEPDVRLEHVGLPPQLNVYAEQPDSLEYMIDIIG